MDSDMDSVRIRCDDIARTVTNDVMTRLASMERISTESLRELLTERFGQIHRDLQNHGASLESMRLQLSVLEKQSALNGRDLTALKSMADRLESDIHGSGGIIPRVRELEKSQSANAPMVAGAGKLVMAILLALVAAAMGFALRGGLGG